MYDDGTPNIPPGTDFDALSEYNTLTLHNKYTEVWVHAQTGEIMIERPGEQLNLAEWVKSTLIPLHADLNLGLFGRVIVFLGGISLPLLFLSGFVLWRWERARPLR